MPAEDKPVETTPAVARELLAERLFKARTVVIAGEISQSMAKIGRAHV